MNTELVNGNSRELPNECLYIIFSYLSLEDICKLSTHPWFRAFYRSPHIWNLKYERMKVYNQEQHIPDEYNQCLDDLTAFRKYIYSISPAQWCFPILISNHSRYRLLSSIEGINKLIEFYMSSSYRRIDIKIFRGILTYLPVLDQSYAKRILDYIYNDISHYIIGLTTRQRCSLAVGYLYYTYNDILLSEYCERDCYGPETILNILINPCKEDINRILTSNYRYLRYLCMVYILKRPENLKLFQDHIESPTYPEVFCALLYRGYTHLFTDIPKNLHPGAFGRLLCDYFVPFSPIREHRHTCFEFLSKRMTIDSNYLESDCVMYLDIDLLNSYIKAYKFGLSYLYTRLISISKQYKVYSYYYIFTYMYNQLNGDI